MGEMKFKEKFMKLYFFDKTKLRSKKHVSSVRSNENQTKI